MNQKKSSKIFSTLNIVFVATFILIIIVSFVIWKNVQLLFASIIALIVLELPFMIRRRKESNNSK